MTRRSVPQIAVDFIRKHEACVLRVYDDRHPTKVLQPGDVVEGTLTAGWGHTGGLEIGQFVSPDDALVWLDSDLVQTVQSLYAVADAAVLAELTVHQYTALISFVFNAGTKNSDGKPWTLWQRLNARDFDQVPLELAKFVNQTITETKIVNGKEKKVKRKVKVEGLVKRRAAEVVEWSTNEPGSIPVTMPSSVTRRDETPPTPSDPVPAGKSKALLASGAAAIAGAPPMIDQVRKTIMPWAEASEYVQTMLGILATIAAVCAAIGLGYMWLQKRNARN